MFYDIFKKIVVYAKQTQDVVLFVAMLNSWLLTAFAASALFYVIQPFLAFCMVLIAACNWYDLYVDHDKNWDLWLSAVISSICAVTASISLCGGVIAAFMGITFAAGPWFFLSGCILGSFQQLTLLITHILNFQEAPEGSFARMNSAENIAFHSFILLLLGSVIGTVIFVMLSSVAPLVGSVCSGLALSFTILFLCWQVLPPNWKQDIKNIAGFDTQIEPEIIPDAEANRVILATSPIATSQPLNFFLKPDHQSNPSRDRQGAESESQIPTYHNELSDCIKNTV